MQEVLRALVDRAIYVNSQIKDDGTEMAIQAMKRAIFYFEARAAKRHGRKVDFSTEQAVYGETCRKCGHIGCKGDCHD